MKRLIATVTVVGLLIVGAAGTAAGVQGDGGTGSGSTPSGQRQRWYHPRRAALRIAAGAAAETIGVSVGELRTALSSGQSVASVAETEGVDPDTVEQAIVGALGDALDRAVSEGRVSEDRAARVRERIADLADRVVHQAPARFEDGGTQQTAV